MTTSKPMPWWGWLLIGMSVIGIPAAIIIGYLLHGLYHMMDGF